nr:uroporphyrinogen-III C-methyltransferase [uncultured Lacibacter sp.]
MSQQSNEQVKGKVILAGAGPGDAELITVKLQQRLTIADVIVMDRLVNPAIIQQHARKDAVIVLAGKQGFNDASFSQDEVTSVIYDYAMQGKTVLRLKGGDVAFFSNVLHELEMLKQYNIPYEIIPGISAAAGASAYAGMPLTARGYSQGVHFITFNPNSSYTKEQWRELAQTSDTLVCYMASNSLTALVDRLMEFGSSAQKPLAVIEQATTVYQQVHVTTLEQYQSDFFGKKFSSPSLVIVGDIVKLHAQFNWFETEGVGSVFQTLAQKKSLTSTEEFRKAV